MRKGAHVRTDRKGNAGGDLSLELANLVVEQSPLARGCGGRWSVLSEIFEDGKSGHGGDLLFAHQAHRFIAQLGRVVDGSDARLCSIECAGLAHGVNRNACTQAVGFLDSGG